MIRETTETLIRLAKQKLYSGCMLVLADDLFEVKRTPSVILQGPKLTEDVFRRCQSRIFDKQSTDSSFDECRFPRLYHLDFDLIITTSHESELLDFQGLTSRFLQQNPVLLIPKKGELNLTELIPLGGLARVNLSNLKQSSGRIRIESCPVFDNENRNGKLIKTTVFHFFEKTDKN